MMPRFIPLFGSALLALFQTSIAPLHADTIILKTGEKLDGTITRMTDTTVEADIKMSTSIIDPRIIQKTDIASIEKPDPSEDAFRAIKENGPDVNSRSEGEYDQAIRESFQPFLRKFPVSPHVAEVKDIIAALQAEKKRVHEGDVKIEGQWYTPTEVERRKDQISAMLLYQKIKAQNESGDTLAALNTFADLDKNYQGTKAYPKAVDYALQIIPAVQKEINTRTEVLKNDLDERKKGMALVPDYQKAELNAAAAADDARVDAALATALKSGKKWTPIFPRSKKSIDTLQATVKSEYTRLSAIKTAPMHASIAAASEARKFLAAGNFSEAQAALQKATTLWPINRSIKLIKADLTVAMATPVPTPTPTPKKTPPPPLKASKTGALNLEKNKFNLG